MSVQPTKSIPFAQASASSQVLQQESTIKTLEAELICPIELVPLSTAVSLVPCAHKIQQAAAKTLFGNTNNDNWSVNSKKECPICRATVLGYMVDHSTRNMSKQLFALPPETRHEMLAAIKNKLPEKSKTVEKDVVAVLPYPGKSAKFIHDGGDWKKFDMGGDIPLCQDMDFKSSTEDSVIQQFSILGYKNGNVVIAIKFSKNSHGEIKKYFKQFDIILDPQDLYISYHSKNVYRS